MPNPLIALDWGTTRARAFLIGEDGVVLAKRIADRGIQSVPAGGFPAAFAEIAGEFRAARPDAAVLLAGMVGCYRGLTVKGGPKGVGIAVNETVVYAFICLFVINVIMTAIGVRVLVR